MILVKPLKPEQFARLKGIFADEFDSDVPKAENSEIFGAFEDGKLIGFLLAEQITILGQIYIFPEKREKSTNIVQSILKYVKNRFDGKQVVGAVASEKRFRNLYKAFGMSEIPGDFFRKNI